MTSRIDAAFARIRENRRGGLVTYLTAGDPTPARSAELLRAVADAGADVLEVGVPFSDPLADGPAIQRATERALAQGMTLRGTLDIVRRTRPSIEAPIVLFTYANPILRMGVQQFARDAADAGIDGVLVLDYPIEEAEPLRKPIVDAGLDPIFLVSPTTTEERIRRSAELGRGFLYLDLTAGRHRRPRFVRQRGGGRGEASQEQLDASARSGLWHLHARARQTRLFARRRRRRRQRARAGRRGARSGFRCRAARR